MNTLSIPSEMGYLKDLEKLFMGSNELYSTIPESIGYLQNLTHLHLDYNNLSGTIPTSFGNLESIGNVFWLHCMWLNRCCNLTFYLHQESLQLNGNSLDVSNAEDICAMFSSTLNFFGWIALILVRAANIVTKIKYFSLKIEEVLEYMKIIFMS